MIASRSARLVTVFSWIEDGGEVAFIDLGDAALILPGGAEAARAELRRVLLGGAYETAVANIDDPDLADQ